MAALIWRGKQSENGAILCFPTKVVAEVRSRSNGSPRRRGGGQSCVANDASPRVGIYRIVPGNGHDSHSVCHHDVPALPGYAETGLLQSFHRPEMRNTCDPAHRLRRDFDFAEFVFARELPGNRKIILNSISDAGESLFFGLSLRPAAWQAGARNAIALFCLG